MVYHDPVASFRGVDISVETPEIGKVDNEIWT